VCHKYLSCRDYPGTRSIPHTRS